MVPIAEAVATTTAALKAVGWDEESIACEMMTYKPMSKRNVNNSLEYLTYKPNVEAQCQQSLEYSGLHFAAVRYGATHEPAGRREPRRSCVLPCFYSLENRRRSASVQAKIMTSAEVCGNNQGLVKMFDPKLMAPAPGETISASMNCIRPFV